MTDFQSFRNAVLEDEDLQEQVISIVNTATANASGLGDGIATLAKTHGFTITSDEVLDRIGSVVQLELRERPVARRFVGGVDGQDATVVPALAHRLSRFGGRLGEDVVLGTEIVVD